MMNPKKTKATMKKFIQERQVVIIWGKSSNCLIGMSIMANARFENISYIATASLLTSLKAGDERLSTNTVTLTQQNFSAEE
jgi:hypothetical protein